MHASSGLLPYAIAVELPLCLESIKCGYNNQQNIICYGKSSLICNDEIFHKVNLIYCNCRLIIIGNYMIITLLQ